MVRILQRCRVGRLATSGRDGFPYITPVNYVWWNEAVYFHCAHEGEKRDNIRCSDKVCFAVDIPLAYLGLDYDRTRPACKVHQFYHSVVIRGRAEIVEGQAEKVAALNALVAAHEEGESFPEITAASREIDLCSLIAVRVERMTGKSDLAQKMTAEEQRQVAEYLDRRGLPGDREAAELIGK